jgi:hypothetical protein
MGNPGDLRGDLLDELLDGGTGYDRVSRVLRAARAEADEAELVGLDAALAEFAATASGPEPGSAGRSGDDAKRHWFRFRLGKLLTAATMTGKFFGGAVVAAGACGAVAVSTWHDRTAAVPRPPTPSITRPATPPHTSSITTAISPNAARGQWTLPPRRPVVPPGQAKKSHPAKSTAPPGQVKKPHPAKPTAPPGQVKKPHPAKPTAPSGHVKKPHPAKPTAPPGHVKKSHPQSVHGLDE